MKAVIQRVKESSVSVNNKIVGRIGKGLMILLGVAENDTKEAANYLAKKIVNLRIFEDGNQKMNRSLLDISGEILIISQFTLLGDCRKGRRPSFIHAAGPVEAEFLYEYFVYKIKEMGVHAQKGKFGAMMAVSLVNDGPVTLILDSK